MISVIFLSENIKNLDSVSKIGGISFIELLHNENLKYQVIDDNQVILKENLNWDDILLVFYDKDCVVNTKIRKVIKLYQEDNIVIPVNISDDSPPPEPVSGIKAFKASDYTNFNDTSKQFLIRVQALLGVKLRNPESKIFISYKSSDGKEIAKEIEVFLKVNGFDVYMDEAKGDYDGQGKLASGVDVQKELQKNLKDASMVLLLDTPKASESFWIKEEINWAIGNLIPVLPIIIEHKNKKGSRFLSLKGLSRYWNYNKSLGDLLNEVEMFLSSIYVSKKRIYFEAKRIFNNYKYSWEELDEHKKIYKSQKGEYREMVKIVSHCVYYDIENLKYLEKAGKIINNYMNSNYRYFIYDGEVLNKISIDYIYSESKIFEDFRILNHQELEAFLPENIGKR